MCKACREACETGMDVSEIMLASRSDIPPDLLPPGLLEKADDIKSGKPFGGDSKKIKKVISSHTADTGDTLLVLGSRIRAGEGAAVAALFSVAEKLGDAPFVLKDEPDTGQIAHFLGFRDVTGTLAKDFLAAVEKTGASKVVFLQAEDARMIAKEYESIGIAAPGWKMLTLPEYLLGLLEAKKPSFAKKEPITVTYHDPGGLGRELRLFEAPRKIIGMIPGVTLVEMGLTRDTAPDCGYGAGMELTHPEISRAMLGRLFLHAASTNAEVLVSGDPVCLEMAAAFGKDADVTIETNDLSLFLEGYLT
jgi:Fe-S oxidoreductase